jgi:hypothetical protein
VLNKQQLITPFLIFSSFNHRQRNSECFRAFRWFYIRHSQFPWFNPQSIHAFRRLLHQKAGKRQNDIRWSFQPEATWGSAFHIFEIPEFIECFSCIINSDFKLFHLEQLNMIESYLKFSEHFPNIFKANRIFFKIPASYRGRMCYSAQENINFIDSGWWACAKKQKQRLLYVN